MTYSINVNKLNESVAVDFEALPDNAKQYVIEYGLKQIVNDSHSGIKDKEEVKAVIERKLQALAEGNITIRRGGSSNPHSRVVEAIVDDLKNFLGIQKKQSREKITEAYDGTWASVDKVLKTLAEKKHVTYKELVAQYENIKEGENIENTPVALDELL